MNKWMGELITCGPPASNVRTTQGSVACQQFWGASLYVLLLGEALGESNSQGLP